MTRTLFSLLQRTADRLGRSSCAHKLPFAVVVALVAAIASSSQASGHG